MLGRRRVASGPAVASADGAAILTDGTAVETHMTALLAGVLLWAAVHLPKGLVPAARARLVARLGDKPWRAIASLLLLASLAMMVAGYRAASPVDVYRTPDWLADAGAVVATVAMLLFVASALPNNMKRYLRHPQLLSVVLWAAGHLFAGGGSRDLVLFGGLGLWAILEMLAINRRDGDWHPPGPVPRRADVIVLVAGLGLTAIAVMVHEWLGVRIVSG
jgi:uncharacterized membrane protein